jgi:phage tail tape-measure protein
MNDKNNTEIIHNEESLANDLNKSLDITIEEAFESIQKLIVNIESTIQDDEIRDEAKEILKTFSKSLRASIELTSDNMNHKNIKKNNTKEEE